MSSASDIIFVDFTSILSCILAINLSHKNDPIENVLEIYEDLTYMPADN